MAKHLAVIPARMGSVGFKHKNRIFFEYTADFIDLVEWIDGVIMSSDDPQLKQDALNRGYEVHNRSQHLSGPDVSIKSVFENLVEEMQIDSNSILWLFYLPILYKDLKDFSNAKAIIEDVKISSLCSFIPAKSHPYNCWHYDSSTSSLEQYIENDIYRRQDLPEAWQLYHYLCCFKPKALASLNNELVCHDTYPIFLTDEISAQLIEIDTPQDYEKWKTIIGSRNNE